MIYLKIISFSRSTIFLFFSVCLHFFSKKKYDWTTRSHPYRNGKASDESASASTNGWHKINTEFLTDLMINAFQTVSMNSNSNLWFNIRMISRKRKRFSGRMSMNGFMIAFIESSACLVCHYSGIGLSASILWMWHWCISHQFWDWFQRKMCIEQPFLFWLFRNGSRRHRYLSISYEIHKPALKLMTNRQIMWDVGRAAAKQRMSYVWLLSITSWQKCQSREQKSSNIKMAI